MLTVTSRSQGSRWLCLACLAVVFATNTALSDASGHVELASDRFVTFWAFGYEDGSSAHPFGLVLSAVADVPPNGTVYFMMPGTYSEALILRKPMVLQNMVPGVPVTIGAGVSWKLIDFPTPGVHEITDDDGDGIVDACEQFLAEKYAPVVYHSSDESNLPANVDWFLQRTSLWFYDDECDWQHGDLHWHAIDAPTQRDLLGWWYANGCGDTYTDFSSGTRSKDDKQRTFYLHDIGEKIGSLNSADWTTYYHAYPNTLGGVTIQYWRCYAFNDAINNHGGDWEGIQVLLGSGLEPARLDYLGHTGIDHYQPNQVQWEGTHPLVFSEGGGHASHPYVWFRNEIGGIDHINAVGCGGGTVNIDPDNPCTFVRQETWTGGQVQWCGNSHVGFCTGQVTPGGPLLNVGAKIAPMNGQVFLRYSGLWGSPGDTRFSSGYWGPAFNETDKGSDGFITAWGAGIVNVDVRRECYPSGTGR